MMQIYQTIYQKLDGFHSSGFGGSVVAIGMDNTVDGAQHSYIMGTSNAP